MSWMSSLAMNGTTDGIFRTLFLFLAIIAMIHYSSLMERPYHQRLASLYLQPWWRVLILLLVLSAALWCPRVGMIVAFIVFLYLHDMNLLMTPLPHLA